jgi:hypothetical protein
MQDLSENTPAIPYGDSLEKCWLHNDPSHLYCGKKRQERRKHPVRFANGEASGNKTINV